MSDPLAEFSNAAQVLLRDMADRYATDKLGGPRDNPPQKPITLLGKHEYLADAPTNLCKACVRSLDDHVFNTFVAPVGPPCKYFDQIETEEP